MNWRDRFCRQAGKELAQLAGIVVRRLFGREITPLSR